MKKPLLSHFLRAGLLSWLFSAGAILAGSESVTVSPDNLKKDVKFYSEYAGQMHALTVQAASGFEFKSGPYLSLNQESLWSSAGSNSFYMADMDDRTEISAEVKGVLVPDGSGGGDGTPPEYPFEISMITRYFRMYFVEPDEGTKALAPDSDETVTVGLINATGSPASGQVQFFTPLGSFGLGATVNVISGQASTSLHTDSEGGIKDKITASGTDVDITDGKTGDGDVESHDIIVPKLVFGSMADRLPIYGGTSPIEESVQVTVTPSIAGTGKSITLKITKLTGSGAATFDSGNNTLDIVETTIAKLRGTANSSTKDNIKILAKLAAKEFQGENRSKTFSVRTWPKNFRETHRSAGGGIIEFDYEWDSESGNVAHLAGITVGEIVTYPGPMLQPPYTNSPDNPTIINLAGTLGGFHDGHSHPGFQTPYSSTTHVGTQYYRFRDTVLMAADTYDNLMGPISITRKTFQSGSVWKYQISKSGNSSEVNLP